MTCQCLSSSITLDKVLKYWLQRNKHHGIVKARERTLEISSVFYSRLHTLIIFFLAPVFLLAIYLVCLSYIHVCQRQGENFNKKICFYKFRWFQLQMLVSDYLISSSLSFNFPVFTSSFSLKFLGLNYTPSWATLSLTAVLHCLQQWNQVRIRIFTCLWSYE